MAKSYLSVPSTANAKYEIKKSVFFGDIAPVENEEEAISFIEEVRRQRPNATHYVHAYRVGYPVLLERFSDDGEPSGTAGMPVLEVIRREDLSNVVVVITRFFGGILLGAGGLVRAYTKTCSMAVEESGKVEWLIMQKVSFAVEYSSWGKVEYELHNLNYIDIQEINYGSTVEVSLLCPEERVPSFESWLGDILSGQVVVDRGSSAYYPTKEQK